jgi:hypothetical protein
MKRIEIEYATGKSPTIGYVKDSDFVAIKKAHDAHDSKIFPIDFRSMLDQEKPTKHRINLNTVKDIKELPN